MQKKKRTKRQPRRGRYDVQMIRTFLEHLLWEVRINHFEHTAEPGTVNPELVEKLAYYVKRYDCIALLQTSGINSEGLTKEQFANAVGVFREQMAALRKQQVEKLESLWPLFEEAFKCAQFSGPMMQFVCARNLLEEGDNSDR